jgi:Putative addiction module component
LEENEASPAIERSWMKEAKRRYEAHKKGKIKARSADEVMKDAYNRFK